MLMEAGVDYLGLPLRLPVNKEDLTEEEAVDVIKTITPPHRADYLFRNTSRRCRCSHWC